MAQFTKWIKGAFQQAFGSARDERVRDLAVQLGNALRQSQQDFSIKSFANQSQCSADDLESAKQIVYQELLSRAWADGHLTSSDRESLNWIKPCLRIERRWAEEVELRFAMERFALLLSKAMQDNILDEHEVAQLRSVAESANASLAEFSKGYFRTEGEGFLRGVFSAFVEDGAFSEKSWQRLINAGEVLGFSQDELFQAISAQAERFVEHVLADAKSDGHLSEAEEKNLRSLSQRLGLSIQFQWYIEQQIERLAIIRRASQGILPSLDHPPGIGIRAGELVHLHAPAKWQQLRVLKSGDQWRQHLGNLTITDNRLIFSGETRSFNVRFGNIARIDGGIGLIALQVVNKPKSVIRIDEEEAIAFAICNNAILLSNQTKIAKSDGQPSRHIPREVRQRVWQRYGGRCAECTATQYLEFDHIVPVAKGGSNSDANVQLLCRGCNSKKSDLI
jgi:hypothetical protein